MRVTTICPKTKEANGEIILIVVIIMIMIILIADMINDYDYSDCINKLYWLQVASQAQYLSR